MTEQHLLNLLPKEVSEALRKINCTIKCKLIAVNQIDQYKKYSVFEDLKDGSMQIDLIFTISFNSRRMVQIPAQKENSISIG